MESALVATRTGAEHRVRGETLRGREEQEQLSLALKDHQVKCSELEGAMDRAEAKLEEARLQEHNAAVIARGHAYQLEESVALDRQLHDEARRSDMERVSSWLTDLESRVVTPFYVITPSEELSRTAPSKFPVGAQMFPDDSHLEARLSSCGTRLGQRVAELSADLTAARQREAVKGERSLELEQALSREHSAHVSMRWQALSAKGICFLTSANTERLEQECQQRDDARRADLQSVLGWLSDLESQATALRQEPARHASRALRVGDSTLETRLASCGERLLQRVVELGSELQASRRLEAAERQRALDAAAQESTNALAAAGAVHRELSVTMGQRLRLAEQTTQRCEDEAAEAALQVASTEARRRDLGAVLELQRCEAEVARTELRQQLAEERRGAAEAWRWGAEELRQRDRLAAEATEGRALASEAAARRKALEEAQQEASEAFQRAAAATATEVAEAQRCGAELKEEEQRARAMRGELQAELASSTARSSSAETRVAGLEEQLASQRASSAQQLRAAEAQAETELREQCAMLGLEHRAAALRSQQLQVELGEMRGVLMMVAKAHAAARVEEVEQQVAEAFSERLAVAESGEQRFQKEASSLAAEVREASWQGQELRSELEESRSHLQAVVALNSELSRRSTSEQHAAHEAVRQLRGLESDANVSRQLVAKLIQERGAAEARLMPLKAQLAEVELITAATDARSAALEMQAAGSWEALNQAEAVLPGMEAKAQAEGQLATSIRDECRLTREEIHTLEALAASHAEAAGRAELAAMAAQAEQQRELDTFAAQERQLRAEIAAEQRRVLVEEGKAAAGLGMAAGATWRPRAILAVPAVAGRADEELV